MDFEIVPYVRAGPILLGMGKQMIRSVLGTKATPFMRGPYAVRETDAFDDLGVQIEYDISDKCESITLCLNAGAIYQNQQIIGRRFGVMRREWEQLDSDLEYDGCSLISRKIGMALYEEEDVVRAVTLFVPGYYEHPSGHQE